MPYNRPVQRCQRHVLETTGCAQRKARRLEGRRMHRSTVKWPTSKSFELPPWVYYILTHTSHYRLGIFFTDWDAKYGLQCYGEGRDLQTYGEGAHFDNSLWYLLNNTLRVPCITIRGNTITDAASIWIVAYRRQTLLSGRFMPLSATGTP